MAYIRLSKNTMTLIYEERIDNFISAPHGKLLFDFLELDFTEYDELYQFVSSQHDFKRSDLDYLIKTYPKTAEKHQFIFKILDVSEDDPDVLREYSAYFLYENQDVFKDIYAHPFIQCCDVYLDGTAIDFKDTVCVSDWKDVQNSMLELIDFCFINYKNKNTEVLTPAERYLYFCETITKRYKYIIKLHSTPLFPPRDSSEASEDIIKRIQGKADMSLVGECLTVKDFVFWEFYSIIEKKLNIKKCKNCGKFFIAKGDYNTDCCDNIPEGEKFTCKKLAAIKARKKKVQGDPILREYQKAYKRMYARLSNHKISNEDFRLWAEVASGKRDSIALEYSSNPSDDIIKKFKKYLGNK